MSLAAIYKMRQAYFAVTEPPVKASELLAEDRIRRTKKTGARFLGKAFEVKDISSTEAAAVSQWIADNKLQDVTADYIEGGRYLSVKIPPDDKAFKDALMPWRRKILKDVTEYPIIVKLRHFYEPTPTYTIDGEPECPGNPGKVSGFIFGRGINPEEDETLKKWMSHYDIAHTITHAKGGTYLRIVPKPENIMKFEEALFPRSRSIASANIRQR